jgi:hypothetical protein
MLPGDEKRMELIPRLVQDVDRGIFQELQANDILFIDSSHVSKAGSDVHLLVFDVLPRLASGVYVHIHDIFYPFEYPKNWIYDGRSWNEAYLIRAFLQHNSDFEIYCFGSYLDRYAQKDLAELLPTCLKAPGQSLWIRRR